MQGPGSSISTLPENLIFDNGSTSSSDAGIDSEITWNSMPIPSQNPNPLPEYRIPSSGTHNPYLQHIRHDMRNPEWCLGETSSSACQYQPYGFFSSENVEINPMVSQTTNSSFLLQNSISNAVPRDLNMSLQFEDQEEDDDCRVIERPRSIGSSNQQIRSNGGPSSSYGGSACGGYLIDESLGEDMRMSCKRKAFDVHAGQSSGAGSSSFFQSAERRQSHTIPENNVSMTHMPTENNVVVNNEDWPERPNLRMRIGVGRPVSSTLFSSAVPGNAESSRRNFRLRNNNILHQREQDPILPENPFLLDVGNSEVLSSRHSSRLVLHNPSLDLNPPPAVESGSLLHGQSSLLDIPNMRRNHQSRWSGAGGARSSRSFAPTAISYEEPTAQRTIQRRVLEHPLFVPASEMGSSSQNPTNWNLSNSIAGNVAYTSQAVSRVSHQSLPQYPRRLSEIFRRSLLSSSTGNDQSISHVSRSGPLVGSQETDLPSGPDNNIGRHVTGSRSALLERHLDGAFGVPHSWRTLAAASEGRSGVMSEQIRHVLDLMRRGEGLRFEDVMILDHSVLFGMADIHDRHRDMRLDVDNMSYEELLALEERIGNVCTGLNEETILSRLKQRKIVDRNVVDQVETEPCSICREEYNYGEDLGSLECGHDFHKDCIKKWLMHKNLCPICKTCGLTT